MTGVYIVLTIGAILSLLAINIHGLTYIAKNVPTGWILAGCVSYVLSLVLLRGITVGKNKQKNEKGENK